MMAQRFKIKLRSFDVGVLERAVKRIVFAAKKGGATVVGPVPLPKVISRFTVTRSPHRHKTSREQFDLVKYTRLVEFRNFDSGLAATLTDWQLPPGVEADIEVQDE